MTKQGSISLIWAMGSRREIGRSNTLPWRLPADLDRAKNITMGHVLLMGRQTYESIGRPLPGRTNVIITRDPLYARDGCEIAHSVEEALERYRDRDIYVFGGSDIYRQTIDLADRLYITRVEGDFEADTFFPEYDESDWELVEQVAGTVDERNKHPHRFEVYIRKAEGQ